MTPTDSSRTRAYWVAVAVSAMTILDLSKIYVALPTISRTLDADAMQLQLITSGYVLLFGLVLVPAGRLGDQWSRRGLLLIGLSIFTLASAACALAPDATTLIVARLVQGIGAGQMMPQAVGLVQQLFEGAARARAFGTLGATVAIATAFGPTLGGLLVQLGGGAEGWRMIFWLNVPLGLVVAAAVVWVLPDVRSKRVGRLYLDPVAIVLFGALVVCFLWPFLLTTGSPDDDPARWWALLGVPLLLAAFVTWERWYARNGRQPLIPTSLFTIGTFRNGVLIGAAYFTGVPGMFLTTTVFLQEGLSVSPVYSGMVGIGFAVMASVGSWIGGRLVAQMGRKLVILGLITLLLSFIALAAIAVLAPASAVAYGMAAALTVGGFGAGLVVSPNQALALLKVPSNLGGLAGAVTQLGQRAGTAIGMAAMLSLFYAAVGVRPADAGEGLETAFRQAYAVGVAAGAVALVLALVVATIDLQKGGPREHG